MSHRILRTGQCRCGCGEEVARGSFFLPRHNKKEESAVILVEYGGIPEFLDKHGYGPGVKNPVEILNDLRESTKSASTNTK